MIPALAESPAPRVVYRNSGVSLMTSVSQPKTFW